MTPPSQPGATSAGVPGELLEEACQKNAASVAGSFGRCLEESGSVVMVRVSQAGIVLWTNAYATTVIDGPVVGRPWRALLREGAGPDEMTFSTWLAAAPRPRLLDVSTTSDWFHSIEITVEPSADDYLLLGVVSAPEQARVGRDVLAMGEELADLARKLSLKNLELEQHRDRLEAVVEERTADLEKANRTFRQILFAMDSVGISLIWADVQTGRLLYVNECTARMLGYGVDELVGLRIPDVDPNFDALSFARAIEALRRDCHSHFESTMRAKDRHIIPVEVTLHYDDGDARTPPHTIAFIKDISERKASEREREQTRHDTDERLRLEGEAKMRSRKLEAVGTLAAGMAHEFNNILGCIVGFAEMTMDTLPRDSSEGRNIAQVLSASFRARDLIARMLAFARQGPSGPMVVDVVASVREALALLRASMRPSVELLFESRFDAASGRPNILADPTQIQQIVMNLCINAAHAMNDRGTIRVTIESADRVEGASPERLGDICLMVSDDGVGMPPAILERMFDPFFTTKAPNEGSGLGLSVVYGVVADLGGVIRAESRFDCRDSGSKFFVFLPMEGDRGQFGDTHGAHIAH